MLRSPYQILTQNLKFRAGIQPVKKLTEFVLKRKCRDKDLVNFLPFLSTQKDQKNILELIADTLYSG